LCANNHAISSYINSHAEIRQRNDEPWLLLVTQVKEDRSNDAVVLDCDAAHAAKVSEKQTVSIFWAEVAVLGGGEFILG
jgi:hypothetical protein